METFFLKLSIMLVPALLAVTCHEVSHGLVADRLGDSTARQMGRLTLNPLRHFDIFGTLMIFLVGIGWAKPVPVNFANLRNPRRDMMLVSASGPVTNFSLALVSALLLRAGASTLQGAARGSLTATILEPLLLMLAFSVYINLLLAIFNLIPLPPLDGGRVAMGLLPYRHASALAKVEPYGMIIIIVLVFFTDIFSRLIVPALEAGIKLLAGDATSFVFARLFEEVLVF